MKNDEVLHERADVSNKFPKLGYTIQESIDAAVKFGEAMKKAMPSAKDYMNAWNKAFKATRDD